MAKKKKLGFIGLGNMGYAIYKGAEKNFDCLAFDPFPRNEPGLQYSESMDELIGDSDCLLLCVKPFQVDTVLKTITKPVQLISIAAGVELTSIKSQLPIGSHVVRSMPNLPLMVGEGCLGYYGDEILYPLVIEIFQPLGMTLSVSKEELLDSITGLSGSGPALVFSFLQALAEGGVKSGLGYKESLDLAIQTTLGSVRYLKEERGKNPQIHPAELRNRVTSPGGTTIFGLAEWEKNAVSSGIIESVYAAYKRSQDLR